MIRGASWSPVLVAMVLAPSLAQVPDCRPPVSGDARLTSITLEAGGIDRMVAFEAATFSYDVWLAGATTVDLGATAIESGTTLRYWVNGNAGLLGTGSGRATLDVEGAESILIRAQTTGRATETYTLILNPPCAGDECDDNNVCTADTCIAGTCEFPSEADGSLCVDGFCDAGTCQPHALNTMRVMFTSDGLAGNGRAWVAPFSLDGTRLYFASAADDLVPGVGDGNTRLFVFDRGTGMLDVIDPDLGFEPSQFYRVDYKSASADYTTLLYRARKSVGLPDPSIGYAHDVDTGVTERVTLLRPIVGSTQDIRDLGTSDDARLVVYRAKNPDVANRPAGIFLYDRDTAETRWVSEPISGMGASSQFGRISGDGRFVVFANIGGAVYVHEIATGETSPVSIAHDGQVVDSYVGSISFDGRFVAFQAASDGVVPEDDNGVFDVFVRDLELGTTSLVSKTVLGELGRTEARLSELSRDGRFVAFFRALEPGGPNQAYVWDAVTDSVILISASASGEPGNGQSGGVRFSEDGSEATFISAATNLVPDDDNRQSDTFVVQLP